MQAAVARSAFGSKQCENMSPWDYFRTLEIRKCEGGLGAKRLLKSKRKKIEGFGAFSSVRTDRDG